MLIGLTGYAGAGKDTAGAYLVERHGFTRIAFADKVRELAYAANPELPEFCWPLRTVVDRYGWERAKREIPGVREILQDLGMAHRHVFGADFWVDQALPRIDVRGLQRLPVRTVVTDVRFDNEAERIRALGGVVVHVWRWGVGPFNVHESERLPRADASLGNVGTLHQLHTCIDNLVKEIS